mmetsp:Transcript_14885/g.32150  ORF Transcript_14885/g.32150 Transcript_14885/m.32150 type:complete len:106 (+) Transcript_14885:744-1061(+)
MSTSGSRATASTRHLEKCRAITSLVALTRSIGLENNTCSSMWYVLIPSSDKAAKTLVVPVWPTLAKITFKPEDVLDSAANPSGEAQAKSVNGFLGQWFHGGVHGQ